MKYLFILLLFLPYLSRAAESLPRVVPTLADLIALDPIPSKPKVEVLGYYSVGDGGGGIYTLTNTITGTNAYGGRLMSKKAGSSWELENNGPTVSIQQFGAKPDDGVDDKASIQAALDWMHDKYGGTVTVGDGVFHSSGTINIPYRVNLIGTAPANFTDGFSAATGDSFYFLGTRSWIRLMSGANVPLIVMNATDGWIRQPSKTLEDGEVVDGRQQDSVIANLTLYTRPQEQTVFNADGIYAMSKWGFTIKDCAIFGFPGYQIRLLDCNAASLKNLYVKGSPPHGTKGIFVWSCADNDWNNISVGGAAGPGIWLSETWKTQGVNMYPWNSWRTNSAYQVTSISSDAFTLLGTTIAIESGDPVMVRNFDWVSDGTWRTNAAMGTLPSGITSSNLYFAVKVSPGVFGIHTNRALAIAGTKLPLSGASGTNWLHIGPATGMYVANNSRQNNLEGMRSDQQSDHGIVFHNAYNNAFTGSTINNCEGSYNGETSIPQAGVMFQGYSINNSFTDAQISDCFFGAYCDIGTSGNVIQTINRTSGGALAQRFDATSGSNFRPVFQTLNGVLTSPLSFGSLVGGSLFTTNTITAGSATDGKVLDLTGNASGVAAIRVTRPGVVTNDLGVSTGSWQMKEVTGSETFAQFGTGATYDWGFGGWSATASTKTGRILGNSASGSNVSGGNVHVRAGPGTGSATPSTVQVYTPVAGSSGSSAQSMVERARFDAATADRDTGMWLWDADAGTLKRVGSTNVTIGTFTGKVLYLK